MCDQDQDQPFIAPGFDSNLHDCAVCLDSGISQEDAGYCTACRMGKRIEQLDIFAAQLKGHRFTEAMRIVFRTTQRTEKAIAAADKALMMAERQAQAARIAELEERMEGLIRTVETHGQWIWRDGEPPFPQNQEWFVAETIYGDKVVLRDRDRDSNYDYQYTTADHTYMAAKNIKRWAQFPDSEYIAPDSSPVSKQG